MTKMKDTVNIRVSPRELALLEAAAEQAHTNLGDFVRRKATEAVKMKLLDQRLVTIPGERLVEFEAWARAPAKSVPVCVSSSPPGGHGRTDATSLARRG